MEKTSGEILNEREILDEKRTIIIINELIKDKANLSTTKSLGEYCLNIIYSIINNNIEVEYPKHWRNIIFNFSFGCVLKLGTILNNEHLVINLLSKLILQNKKLDIPNSEFINVNQEMGNYEKIRDYWKKSIGDAIILSSSDTITKLLNEKFNLIEAIDNC
jgi:uncharacterized Rmd1/YagE family protein